MRYDEGLYFKSAPEIAERFPDRPDVLENTLSINDGVNLGFEKTYHLPAFPLPDDHTDENDYLVFLATEGAKRRYGDPLPEAVQERLDYELGVITETGYAGYFLITWDFIDWARRHGIPGGSGPGVVRGLDRRLFTLDHESRSPGVQPPLRAFSESRADLDAGHRCRLLL